MAQQYDLNDLTFEVYAEDDGFVVRNGKGKQVGTWWATEGKARQWRLNLVRNPERARFALAREDAR